MTSFFPRRWERVRRDQIPWNFCNNCNCERPWPGITNARFARQLSLVLNMSLDICDPVCYSAPPLLAAPLIPLRIPTDTGDRPYKCQHCGDQFARRSVPPPIFHLPPPHSTPYVLLNSDLLSRHINKCHPNEKPLVSSTPSRRKGTSSASRATTSKQACDQCVQSTLPCDGANPCCQSLVGFPSHYLSHALFPQPSVCTGR